MNSRYFLFFSFHSPLFLAPHTFVPWHAAYQLLMFTAFLEVIFFLQRAIVAALLHTGQ